MLREIVAHKREELEERRRRVPLDEVRRRAAGADAARPFRAAVAGPGIGLIAEVKGASPSEGTIRAEFDAAAIARGYERAGAAAISVLTDGRYFHGTDGHLVAVRRAVRVPVLRKDFTVDPYQVYEARALGADAVLLIVAVLPAPALADLQRLAHELGMAALVEVHTEAELDTALAVHAPLIGVNNRDLQTLDTSLDTTRRLRPRIPAGVTVVAESGFEERSQVEEMERLGISAVLVGTVLMRAPDPPARLRELLGTAG